ncbi:1,3-propanediol dehydrogenase [bioreactor metagenome]|uniref:1,3-propanediol dehydrogenase n=1 Tax=bioreactor metagenome TaxID=1076179 RepID=A0A645FVB5_9ZZZZ
MLLGSLIAGICFGNADVAGGHCMSESLGGLYDTPHGVANAIMLPYIMEFNYVADLKKFARIAAALGENISALSERDAAYAAIESVRKLDADLNIPALAEIGAKETDLEELAMRSSVNVSVGSNPRQVTKDDFYAMFKKALAE